MTAASNVLQLCSAVRPQAARLLTVLADNARITNSALAARVGMPASTCLTHVQALASRGLVTGYHTQVDRRQLGLKLDVLIGLQLKDKRAPIVHALIEELREYPHIMAVMRTSGAFDLMVQALVRDTDHLIAEVIDPITDTRHVAGTQTILVHEHWQRMSLVGRFFRV